MHEIGYLVLLIDSATEVSAELRRALSTRLTVEEDRRHFRASIAEIGAYLLESWGLADDVVALVRAHREPWIDAGPFVPLAFGAVQLAHAPSGRELNADATAYVRECIGEDRWGSWIDACVARSKPPPT